MTKERRLNVLHIMADQLAPHFLPNYGHPLVDAPHIASLSDGGVTFDNAYTNSPLCVPARAAMATGKLASTLRIYDSAGELTSSTPTLAHYLRASGYHTCLSGKAHFIGADQLHGFEDRLASDMCMADFGMSGDWDRGEEPMDFFHTLENVTKAGIAERAAQQDHDEEVTYRATQWLYDWVRQPAETRRPFYLNYSLSQPHDPYVTPQRYWKRYARDQIDLPVVPNIPLAQRDAYSAWLYRHYDRGEYTITEDQIRAARHAYYGNISYVDDLIGRVLDTLERIDETRNTLIVFCSDHGDMLGERGQWYKMSPFEQSVRIPLVIKFPDHGNSRRVARNVSLVDVAPTIMDLATDGHALALSQGVDPMEGNSLRALLGADGHTWPDLAISEMMFEGRTEPAVMVRRGNYKYVRVSADDALLFDMSSDPHELENLSGKSDHKELEADFKAYVMARWNFDEIEHNIRLDNRRRIFIQKVLYTGKTHPWDFQPLIDAAHQYYRSDTTWLETEKRSMYHGSGRGTT